MYRFKKIDVFIDGKYLHSTNAFRTCREAIARAKQIGYELEPGKPGRVTAFFDRDRY